MQWSEVKITFQGGDRTLASELISEIFYEMGVKGVIIDDPDLSPSEGWAPDALPQPEDPAVIGFLPVDDHLARRHHDLERTMSDLAANQDMTYSIAYRSVDEEDWAESWKKYFWPQQITSQIVVKPTWREYDAKPNQLVIDIDPGMAFGTGTHPTTALCMMLLETFVRPDMSLLDVGTGSGILLITAAKLGAAKLAGVDLDPEAVNIARQNLKRNAIPKEHYTLNSGHLLNMVDESYDVVVANILAEVVLELLDHIGNALKPGGIFICSGIIGAFKSGVENKMTACGFSILDVKTQGDWVAIAGRMER